MSFSQMRPQTSQLVELHVFYVPEEVWNFKLNTVPVALTSKFISAGFIRVSPHITLRALREKLGEYLGGVAVADKFKFLKCIGKKLAVVKAKQETELELKSFAPPYALYPELYLLPGAEYFEDVYPLSSSTEQRRHFNAEANRYGHGSRLPNLPQQKSEKSRPFLESIQSSHQLENKEVHSPAEWTEKESVPVLNTDHEQDYNRIAEKQTQFRVKDQNGSSGSLFTPSHSNPADRGSGKSCMLLQKSQQNHHSEDQKEHNTPKWNDKAKGNGLHINHSDEQRQTNQPHQNRVKYQKELNTKLLVTNMENNDHKKDTKLRRDRTRDSGNLEILEDQTTEYIHRNQSLLQYRTSKSVTGPGEKLDNQVDENKQSHPTCPKEYISPPSPPFLSLSVNPAQVPAVQAEIREEWKKKYFETKKATASLEDVLKKLRQDLELYHQKLLLQLEARDSRKQPNSMTNLKNNKIIEITTVQHELDQLRKKLDDTKMKLIIEIKMRKQAASDLRALRAELTQKKIHSALILQSGKSGI
ncbi:spermatogenesis-associated protein 1 isoform X3 [Cygnus atratus]|uniref:spermatogenesis-associated protein 1 isoform X3 n=1 Tax=Cygnus atratus TaxID=8868 RepID=UPI0015D643F9|nr:spermatogenesis-associated protein 1 isoform X3 [Cygnus atratus]